MTTKNRSLDWLRQAQNDLEFAEQGIQTKHYSQVCFLAQQAAEKAIKAIAYFQEFEVRGHSVAMIARSLGYNGEIEEAGKILDQYYISTRYPDALPGGAPFEFFTEKQARESLTKAALILQKALKTVK